jgi:hypothetical protein
MILPELGNTALAKQEREWFDRAFTNENFRMKILHRIISPFAVAVQCFGQGDLTVCYCLAVFIELGRFVASVLGDWLLENAPEYHDLAVLLADLLDRRRHRHLDSDLPNAWCYLTSFRRKKSFNELANKERGFAIDLSYIPVLRRPDLGLFSI